MFGFPVFFLNTIDKPMNTCKSHPSHPLYKTRICRHWLRGHCKLGDDVCNFKHGWYDKPPVKLTRTTSMPSICSTNIIWGNEPLPRNASAMSDGIITSRSNTSFFSWPVKDIIYGTTHPCNTLDTLISEFEFITYDELPITDQQGSFSIPPLIKRNEETKHIDAETGIKKWRESISKIVVREPDPVFKNTSLNILHR